MIVDRRPVASFAEAAFCVFALSMFLGAYAALPLRVQDIVIKGGGSNPYNAAAMALVLVGTAAFAVVRRRRILFIARHGGAVNLFAAMAVSSVLWSPDPLVSGRKALTLLETLAFAYYLAARYPVERVIRLAAVALGLALLASAALAVGVPAIGVMSGPGLAGMWSGVFPHKSSLGGAAAMGVMCFGWLWKNEPGRRWLHAPAVLFCVFLAVMAQSKTAQMTIGLTVGLAVFLPLLRLPGMAKVWAVFIMGVCALAVGAFLFFYFRPIMEALGKDASLTGRVPTWLGLLDMAWQYPLGGYGYSGFFVGTNPEVEDVWRRAGWTMWDAHSTFIEMLLQLGIPGVAVATWALFELIARSLRSWAEGERPWASFAVVYGVIYAATSTVESVMFRAGDLQTVLFPLLFVALRVDSARRVVAATPRPSRSFDAQYGFGR